MAIPLGSGWYDHDWTECPEVAFLKLLPEQKDILFFDLGAHQAVVALMIKRLLRPRSRGVAVEGSHMNVQTGFRNLSLNGEKGLVLLNAVVAAHEGEIDFNLEWNGSVVGGAQPRSTRKTRAVTIDQLAAQYGPPTMVLLDVEGYEVEALHGGTNVLKNGAAWLVEVHSGCGLDEFGGSVASLLQCFDSATYALWIFSETTQEWLPLEEGAIPAKRFFLAAIPRCLPV